MSKSGKLTPKQESFAKLYMLYSNASEAYRQAYNAENMKSKTINEKASRLLKEGKVRARIKELQERAMEKHDISVDSLTNELEQARMLAMINKAAAAMVSATMGKAKLHGLLVDNHKLSGDPDNPLNPIHTTLEIIHVNADGSPREKK